MPDCAIYMGERRCLIFANSKEARKVFRDEVLGVLGIYVVLAKEHLGPFVQTLEKQGLTFEVKKL